MLGVLAVVLAALPFSARAAEGNNDLFRLVPSFVDYRNHSGAAVKRSIVEMVGAGVCLLDYDLDGLDDLYFPDGGAPGIDASNRLYRNLGELVFQDTTEEAGVGDEGWAGGCAVADIDNDGDPDLYVTNTGPNVLYRNNGDGTFTTLETGAEHPGWSTGAAFGDLDGDGLVDLYVCNYIDRKRADLGARCRYFGIEVFCGPNGLPGEPDALFHNENGRSFRDVTAEAGVFSPETRGLSVLLADLDGDRLPDIHVANDATIDLLFRNLGGMRFEDVSLVSGAGYSGSGVEQSGMGSTAGDFDADGDLDLYVTNFQRDYNTLYENQGELRFTDVTARVGLAVPTLPYLGWGTVFFDADNDGRLDLFVANGHIYSELEEHREIGEPYAQKNQLFLGDGRTFEEVPLAGDHARVSRGTALGDLNQDGALDVVVNNLDSAPDVYVGRAAGTWLRVRLIGTASNRDGLGATLVLSSGRARQFRELRTSDGFLGANEPVAHFGLGELERVDKLVVTWPSGKEDVLEELEGGTSYLIKEGIGWLR
ncbi:MAG TPA: CRTAC1 family protein [Vicinamibacteria bacterium]|nr:CRTAC1 family protein [Vicinamibacteria bacterium]